MPVDLVNGSTPGEEGRRFDSRFGGTVRIPFFPTSVTLPPVYLVNGSTPGDKGRRFDSRFCLVTDPPPRGDPLGVWQGVHKLE